MRNEFARPMSTLVQRQTTSDVTSFANPVQFILLANARDGEKLEGAVRRHALKHHEVSATQLAGSS
jgi:hypothetical protein